jgi:hypothetical protein
MAVTTTVALTLTPEEFSALLDAVDRAIGTFSTVYDSEHAFVRCEALRRKLRGQSPATDAPSRSGT